MSKVILKGIVILLSILIFVAFIALVYGMYLKLSISESKILDTQVRFSSNLDMNEKIKNIEVLDKNRLLILIENKQNLKGAIYDIDKNKIIRFIDR